MLKYLAVLGVVIGLAVFIARQDKRAAQESAEKAARLGNAALPAVANKDHAEEHVYDPERDSPSWYGFFRWPNGSTTWAIILTLLAIAEQTSQTRKAAEATRDSVLLQEKAMEQWVDIANWRADILQLIPGEGGHLVIGVDIVNRTDYPLRITGGQMIFKHSAGFKGTLDFPRTSLTPHVPYESAVAVEITEKQVVNYVAEPILVTVAGAWSHTGVLEKPTPQVLGGVLRCAKDSTVFTPKLDLSSIEDSQGKTK
jgi:hypothetical protein